MDFTGESPSDQKRMRLLFWGTTPTGIFGGDAGSRSENGGHRPRHVHHNVQKRRSCGGVPAGEVEVSEVGSDVRYEH